MISNLYRNRRLHLVLVMLAGLAASWVMFPNGIRILVGPPVYPTPPPPTVAGTLLQVCIAAGILALHAMRRR